MSIAVVAALAQAVRAGDAAHPSAAFDQHGVIVDAHTFFKTAAAHHPPAEPAHGEVAGRALVTAAGVYSFLETPENQQQLAGTAPGSVVHIRGKLLERGALLHIDSLAQISHISLDLDLAGLRADPGREVALKGVNKCQCGLDVADLPHSCALGHLHHLEAEDGRTYHYLQFAGGKNTFLGEGSHFKAVEVKGRLFPGHFLLVEEVKIN